MSNDKNKPLETLRDGALKVALFRNQSDKGDFVSVVPGRIYTDSDGNIKETKSLSGSEPLRMANLLTQGYGRAAAHREAMKGAQKPKQERER